MEVQINTSLLPQVSVVGEEATKIIIIDNFLFNLSEFRACVYGVKDFQHDGKTAYPGVRVELPENYTKLVMSVVKPVILEQYNLPTQTVMRAVMGYYSLLTKKESELEVLQRIPHFDNNKRNYFAVLHYLNDGEFGGTGFFRHRPTKFENISHERKDIYMQSVNTFMASRGFPEQKYINGSTNHYELFAQIPYMPNRVIIYPGCILHSGLVTNADVSDDPAKGRLTANVFIDCV